jgi:hypothetical protein
MAVKIDDVRDLTAGLPRSYEVFVRGRTKFRVGRIVYLAFSRDEALMGFAFPKEEREAALETYPDKFLRPKPSDMRYQWLVVRLEAIDKEELRELVFDAWRMVVPKKLASLSDDELRQQGVAQRAGASESPQVSDRSGTSGPWMTGSQGRSSEMPPP